MVQLIYEMGNQQVSFVDLKKKKKGDNYGKKEVNLRRGERIY